MTERRGQSELMNVAHALRSMDVPWAMFGFTDRRVPYAFERVTSLAANEPKFRGDRA